MENEDYNGWTNRETWAVMLHLDNDQALQHDYMELYEQVSKEDNNSEVLTDEQNVIYQYEDQLREWITDILHPNYWLDHNMKIPEWTINMMVDSGSLWIVNWKEITDRIIGNIKAEEEYANKL